MFTCKPFYLIFKRAFDIVCSFLGIVVSSPFWLVAVVGILCSDPGPVFYFARRVGKNNKEFKMIKFRSMLTGVANESVFRGDENRIFPFGKFIRAAKIDELPQLINILVGDMSFVGPRPAAVAQMEITRGGKYSVASQVQSGITGPSALYDYIYGDTVQEADEYEKRVLPTRLELDVYYAEHMGVLFDIKMICYTVVCVLAEVLHRETPRIYAELVGYVRDTEEKT